MSDLLTHDDEGVDENGPNDIDYLRMLPGQTNDFTFGVPPTFNNEYVKYSMTTGIFSALTLRAKQCLFLWNLRSMQLGGKLRLTTCLLVIFQWGETCRAE